MLTLVLMRHAKSSWDFPDLADHDRPLNKRGYRSATAMGNWLRDKGYLPEAALSSTSKRTVETFEGLALDISVEWHRSLFHASAETMLDALRKASGPSVLMLGHNPGIGDLAERIVKAPADHPRFHDYPSCATLVARFDSDDWGSVNWGSGTVIDFAIPRELG